MPENDLRLEQSGGSVAFLTGLTAKGRQWVEEHLAFEQW